MRVAQHAAAYYADPENDNEICYSPGQLPELAANLLAYHYKTDGNTPQ